MKNKKNYRGFTLIEMLYALLIMGIVLTFFMTAITSLEKYRDNSNSQQFLDWQTFLLQMAYETKDARIKRVGKNIIYFEEKGDNGFYSDLEISQYGSMIRKQKSGKGHQPMLLHIKNVSFHLTDNDQLRIKVIFEDGEIVEGQLSYENKEEKKEE